MSVIAQPHDRLFRQLMSEPKVAREFFEQHLPLDLKNAIDLTSLSACKESYVDETLRLNYVDMLFTATLDNHPACLWLLLEHTSQNYPKLPLTLLKYTVNIMEDQYNKHKTIPLVYPLVLHHNEQAYTGTTDIRNMIDAPREFIDAYFLKPFQLVDLNHIDDKQLREKQYAGIVQTVLKYSRTRDFLNYLEDLMQHELQTVLQAGDHYFILNLLNYSIIVGEVESKERLVDLTNRHLSKPLGDEVMTLAEKLITEGEQRGEQRGKQIGEQKAQIAIAKELLKEGTEPAFVARITTLSLAEVRSLQSALHDQ